jgi:hypothetical protein
MAAVWRTCVLHGDLVILLGDVNSIAGLDDFLGDAHGAGGCDIWEGRRLWM